MSTRLAAFGVLPILVAILALVVYRRYGPGSKLAVPTWDRDWRSTRIFTKEELATKFNGKGNNPSYLVVLGEVYDVSSAEYYKEGSGYHIFIGKDATTAFVTGKFEGEPSDDVSGLQDQQMKGIEDWVKFYRNHEKYKFMGVVEGKFYNKEGRRTTQWQKAKERFDAAREAEIRKEQETKLLPNCNSQWTSDSGTRVWCEESMRPAGFDPSSPLVPRMVDRGEGDGSERCACVMLAQARDDTSKYRQYDNCPEASTQCSF